MNSATYRTVERLRAAHVAAYAVLLGPSGPNGEATLCRCGAWWPHPLAPRMVRRRCARCGAAFSLPEPTNARLCSEACRLAWQRIPERDTHGAPPRRRRLVGK